MLVDCDMIGVGVGVVVASMVLVIPVRMVDGHACYDSIMMMKTVSS